MPRIFWSNVLGNKMKSPMPRIFWWNVLGNKIKSPMPRTFWWNVLRDEKSLLCQEYEIEVSYVKNILMKCIERWK